MEENMFRTDLALEAREMMAEEVRSSVSGIMVEEKQTDDVKVTKVRIETESASRALGKKQGTYVTFEVKDSVGKDAQAEQQLVRLLAREVQEMIPQEGTVLVVGLGNRSSTPDALGPRTVEGVFVTRHMREMMTDEAARSVRSVCSFAPGVLGVTGIETAEILRGVAEHVQPAVIIAVDALASSSSERVATTVQLSDTGIHPGSGVGNRRFGIDKESMGVPVIAVGVPTVIYASTIALDILHSLERTGQVACRFARGERVTEDRRRAILRDNMPESLSRLMVTPRDIDRLIADMARIISRSINKALYPSMTGDGQSRYLQ
ncbi:MAG: GPR endopeptidase [Selenomonadales bacterium]|nr:GPR endopeptidase [Selenomonadales bacterium]